MNLIQSNSGSYYYFGGLLLVLGGFLEFILGNTFTFDAFSLKGSRISKPTQPGLPTVLAKEEAIDEMVQELRLQPHMSKCLGFKEPLGHR